MSLAFWLKRASIQYPYQTALITRWESLDYRRLYGRTGSLAARLRAEGLRAGEPLGVLSHQGRVITWTAYVAAFCGCPLFPLPPERSENDLEHLTRSAAIRQALTDDSLSTRIPNYCRKFPSIWLGGPVNEAELPARPLSPDEVQLLIATSGSTGTSRGVMLTGNNLASAARASRDRLGLGPGDIWLACLPLYHIGGFSILLRCAEAGATLLLDEGFNACRILEDLETRKVTHISLVPQMLSRLLEHNAHPPPSLRVALIGGGPLGQEIIDRALSLNWPIHPTYGMSETASQVATIPASQSRFKSGDVGTPLAEVTVEIVDEAGLPTNSDGRIRISGPVVMAGYANAEGRRGMGLINGVFTSSDLGHIDSQGHLHVIGRRDDMLISGGRNIHPREVESRLAACPGITDVAVSARSDQMWGELLVAVYVGDRPATELEGWCRTNLPSSLRPRKFRQVDKLPRDRLGKTDRVVLRSLMERW